MTNKLLSPLAVFAVVFVGLAFAAVAFAVFVTRGKSKFWIDKKMRTGGLLLTLSAMVSSGTGCGSCQPTCYEPVEPTCYDVAAINQVFIDADSVSIKNAKITGEIQDIANDKYSFSIIKGKDTLQKGDLNFDAADSVRRDKKFTIGIDKKIKPDTYRLVIFADGLDLMDFDIKITE